VVKAAQRCKEAQGETPNALRGVEKERGYPLSIWETFLKAFRAWSWAELQPKTNLQYSFIEVALSERTAHTNKIAHFKCH